MAKAKRRAQAVVSGAFGLEEHREEDLQLAGESEGLIRIWRHLRGRRRLGLAATGCRYRRLLVGLRKRAEGKWLVEGSLWLWWGIQGTLRNLRIVDDLLERGDGLEG